MKNHEYQQLCLKTESKLTPEQIQARFTPETVRALHAAIGLATESGELLDQLKKHLFYGKPLDRVNLIEEAGDLMWYLSVLLDFLLEGQEDQFEFVQFINIAKLQKRYGGSFDAIKATQRDLSAEREVLEKNK